MRPLDRLSSIKMKLGVVILAAVGVVVLVNMAGVRAGIPLLLVGVVAGALALGMVQILARGMTSPLRDMVAATRAMARGDYSRRVRATSRDEVGELARAFNTMAAELAETERLRRDLVANVSHELRTPITALQVVLENLVDDVEPPDPETLRTMLAQTQRLGALINQLLDLSRLEAGTVPLERRSFEVGPVLRQAVEESRLQVERATDRRVRLSVSIDPPGLRAHGDPERIHQVVANLLENAVRHSPEDGEVVVATRAHRDLVRIEVRDQGPGIPEEEAERVFERFYRGATGESVRGGTGLGLAIARWIVDLHGGDIRAEPNVPHGCRMVVALPKDGA
ncbi:MAG: HAMP domain-containing sensor histidine kinase [Actinomycetota bacterium]